MKLYREAETEQFTASPMEKTPLARPDKKVIRSVSEVVIAPRSIKRPDSADPSSLHLVNIANGDTYHGAPSHPPRYAFAPLIPNTIFSSV